MFIFAAPLAAESDWDASNHKIQEAVDRGDLVSAVKAAESSVEIARSAFGEKHINVADSKNNLANLYLLQNRFDEAEKLYKEGILIENELRPESIGLADSLFNLSMLYASTGRYPQAAEYVKKSLAIKEKALGAEDPAVLKLREMLKTIEGEQKKKEALEAEQAGPDAGKKVS